MDRIFLSTQRCLSLNMLKVIYHPLYGMNSYVLILGNWLSCDSQSPQKENTCAPSCGNFDLFVTKISYYIRGDRSPLKTNAFLLM